MGYSTGQVASEKTIHPSKRWKLPAESASASTSYYHALSDSGTESEGSKYEDEDESTTLPTKKHNKSKVATSLVTATKLSPSEAAKMCKQLSFDGIDIPTPSQAAIYKSTYKDAAKLKEEVIEKVQMEEWSLLSMESTLRKMSIRF